MTIRAGQILADDTGNHYRVEEFIAAGGMGAVYKVWDLRRNVSLAMKVLHTELADDPSVFKRFEREARALRKLAHPNIVPFYGLFKTDEFAFLLEQYVDGPTLKQVLKRLNGQPLPIEQALTYLKALSAGLGYAHTNGVVHCDVKPGNVMVDHGGSIYLTDFGIARHADSTTTTFSSAGTPTYMAPEQCRGEAVTPETDIYALGVMLYEMVTGVRPFQGNETGTGMDSATAGERIRYAHVHLAPPDPRQVNPALTPALTAVILKALEKQPQARYRTAHELYEAACAAAGVNLTIVPNRAAPSNPAPSPIPSEPTKANEVFIAPRSVQRYKGVIVLAMLALMTIVGLGLFIFSSQNQLTRLPAALPATNAMPTPAADSPPVAATSTELPAAPTQVQPAPTYTPAVLAPTPTPISLPGASTHPHEILVSNGPFTRGSTRADITRVISELCPAYPSQYASSCRESAFLDELPLAEVAQPTPGVNYFHERETSVNSFLIDTYEVTNAEYAACVAAGACPSPDRSGLNPRRDYYYDGLHANHPVTYVRWQDAQDYCRWAGQRLPTADEWEKAARADDARIWPWGNSFTGNEANYRGPYQAPADQTKDRSSSEGDPAPVGSYSSDRSPAGVMDLAGNVMEWVGSWYAGDRAEIRGGSWNTGSWTLRAASRTPGELNKVYFDVGFRCARSATP